MDTDTDTDTDTVDVRRLIPFVPAMAFAQVFAISLIFFFILG